ncbi:cell wall metabolism sensor histidine kinase WalK [Paenibacillus sp. V4I5]|uniref:sensor histidine kinase n=1 Tax=Paenibacillus sp. V4I5 TaxID=3042306 RepID=UPI00278F29FA|nr:ATP-binding protein [Paenibacillus sp. V4I5]MDQ0919665.1 signal transduction histidine kinase [Paenibacillus sp. V4I5]
MKLRVYLLIASGVSTSIILLSLFICYQYMLLRWKDVILLTTVTLGAAGVSMLIHYFMTRPLEKAIHAITEETTRISEGHFEGQVPQIGPAEFQRLADQFNRMTGKLNESFQKLRTAEASRKELVANVSHDLRTPMASIQAFVEALQDDVIQDKETFARYLQTIRLETGRLNGLIQELFKLSQLDAGGTEFVPERYHVDHLLLDGLQSLAFQLEEKQLQVDVDLPDRLPPVAIMPQEMKRVLSNILDNAIRHSPVGGTIEIKVEQISEQYVQLYIQDHGQGIDEEDRSKVFDRFYRADPSRTRASGGAGLGLAIAKSIVHLHGGTIGVDSHVGDKGNGSRFWFTLPIY